MSSTERFHWEDFEPGQATESGSYRVTEEEIVAFAAEFDPQPFHLDAAAAEHTLLAGLAASGWHSCAMLMHMICDSYIMESNSMGSPGMEDVRWREPVRPGDVLRMRRTCLEARASRSRPEMGLCRFAWEVLNQEGMVVVTATGTQMFVRRGAGAPS